MTTAAGESSTGATAGAVDTSGDSSGGGCCNNCCCGSDRYQQPTKRCCICLWVKKEGTLSSDCLVGWFPAKTAAAWSSKQFLSLSLSLSLSLCWISFPFFLTGWTTNYCMCHKYIYIYIYIFGSLRCIVFIITSGILYYCIIILHKVLIMMVG